MYGEADTKEPGTHRIARSEPAHGAFADDRQTAAPVLPAAVQVALDWMEGHPGWRIGAGSQWTQLADREGKIRGGALTLAALVDSFGVPGLDSLPSEAQLALLRVELAPWCVVQGAGEGFEATMHGVHLITAPCACLLRYFVRRSGW